MTDTETNTKNTEYVSLDRKIAALPAPRRLIVVHTPKCGGTSLLASLKGAYGPRRIHIDYPQNHPSLAAIPIPRWADGNETASAPGILAPSTRLIIGHFHADKYLKVWDHCIWATLMRDPVDRVISEFLKKKYTPATERTPRVRRRINNGKMDIVLFARTRPVKTLLSNVMFGGVDMSRFHVILWHDDYERRLQELSQLIGVPLEMQKANVSEVVPGYAEESKRIHADPGIMRHLSRALEAELAFYWTLRDTMYHRKTAPPAIVEPSKGAMPPRKVARRKPRAARAVAAPESKVSAWTRLLKQLGWVGGRTAEATPPRNGER